MANRDHNSLFDGFLIAINEVKLKGKKVQKD